MAFKMSLICAIHLMCVGFIIGTTCPHSSQWKLRGSGYCNYTHPWYNCLYDQNRMEYIEFCRDRPIFQRPGYKFIIRGNLDGKQCEDAYYQPIKFWTNGSSNCIFKKSTCNEEGQLAFNNGNGISNRKCRCDYTAGYAFVTKPNAHCFCDPEQEDCTCYLTTCKPFHLLSPDYVCIRQIQWSGDFNCPLLTDLSLNEEQTTKSTVYPFPAVSDRDNEYEYNDLQRPTLTAIIIVLLTTCVICFTTCKMCLRKLLKKYSDEIEEKIAKGIKEGIQHYIADKAAAKLQIEFNYKDIVTTIKNRPIVEQLLARRVLKADDKEEIEKNVGSVRRNQKLLEILWNKGTEEYKEFLSVLETDSTYKHLVTKMKNTKASDDDDSQTLVTEWNGIYNEKVPKNIRDLHEHYLMDWLKSDQKFVVTEATMYVKKQLRTDHCVIIVGGPGSGKSSILRHTAIELCNNDDFDVIPVTLEPSIILQYHNYERKQIFVIDDFCGKYEQSPPSIDIWALQIKPILNLLGIDITGTNESQQCNSKLIITCSSSICKDEYFELLKISKKYICKLCDYKLSNDQMREMMCKVRSNRHDRKSLEGYKPSNEFESPLLATLCDGRSTNEQNQLLNDPFNYIVTDLREIRDQHKIEYCVIAVCAFFESSFKEEFLKTEELSNFLTYLEEFYLEYDLSQTKRTLISKIKDTFQQLEKTRLCTYIIKTDQKYHFVHERIYDIAAAHCGQTFFDGFIDHASSQFIRERYCLASEKHTKPCVVIKDKNRKRYFDRLFRDLENGIIGSTFRNKQLQNKEFRKQLAVYCEKRKSKIIEIFDKLNCREKTSSHLDHNMDMFEPIDLTNEYTHFRNKIYSNCYESNMPLIESVWLGYLDLVKLLLEMKCEVNITDILNRSPLFIASFLGYIEIVKLLLNYKAQISKCDIQGRSPLYAACEEGRNAVVEHLANQDTDIILKCDQNRRSPIFVASATGHKNIVQFLIKKSKSNISDADHRGQTPLFVASLRGRKDIVRLLLQNNADIDRPDKRGCSPLFIAAMNGHFEVVETLLSKNAKIVQCDHDGRSPLFIACQEGHLEIVKILLKYDTTCLSVYDWQNQSPMFIACFKGYCKIVKLLADNKADVNHGDEDGKSPLFVACERGHDEVVHLLLEREANVEESDKDGRSPFYVASRNGNVEIMKHLLMKGANPSHFNKWGGSVLNITCREGHFNAVKLLLEKEADHSKKDAIGNSPLYIAAEEGHTEIVKILLKYNADQNVLNKENMTPLHVACEHGHKKVVQVLLENKANVKLKDKHGNTPKNIASIQKRNSIVKMFDTLK